MGQCCPIVGDGDPSWTDPTRGEHHHPRPPLFGCAAQCNHKIMKALAIHRHNMAVYLILKELAKETDLRGATVVADLGDIHLDKLGQDTNTIKGERVQKRIPLEMMERIAQSLDKVLTHEDSTTATLLAKKITTEGATALRQELKKARTANERTRVVRKRLHLRPDILLVQYSAMGRCRTIAQHGKDRTTITILEVGYCREGRGKEKMTEKSTQHDLLTHLLKAAYPEPGFTVNARTMTLGVTGAIYNDVTRTLQALGIVRNTRLYNKLIDHAHNSTHAMVVKRRQLQAAGQTAGQIQPHRGQKRKRPPDK